ncbi:hypothetical protein [Hymenobacter psychrophilus]|uniref:Lipoprotein n=1 Tax=Hymenobacter psychrophilus TaxID=651662 RepID=A0A1H3EDJ1_9BACT|nr:hypothetical protein [Hymenobacter psychrophilus]SDX76793.1 hypothetical protein SAMN04488069_10392 [Hymenobacter psychrophilus]
MKKTLLLLSAAAAFTLGSCSENQPAETTTTTTDTTMTTATTTGSMDYSPEAVNSRADRMAGDMATSMKLDEPTRTRVRDIYVARGQRMAELNQKYMTDTMGMAAARRDVYSNTDAEMKTVFTDPTQYTAYESSRSSYMDDRYMDSGSMGSSDNMSMGSSSADMSSSEMDKMKMKGEDGSKLKVKADGDVKMKDAEGNKAKMDADDGTVKMKPQDGDKTVIK